MNIAHEMTVSRNGQVSLPAAARARWDTRKVLVVDLGDRIVVRPLPDGDAFERLQGKYAGVGRDTAVARRAERRAESGTRQR